MGWEFLTNTGQVKGGPGTGVATVPAVSLTSPLVSGVAQAAAGQVTLNNWQTELYDTDNMHDASVNPGRITIQTSGLYTFSARIWWDAAAVTGFASMMIKKNGTVVAISDQVPWNNSVTFATITTIDYQDSAVAGDYYEVDLFQNTGGIRSWAANPTHARFQAVRNGSDTAYASKTLPNVKAYRSAALNHDGTSGFTVIPLDGEIFDIGTTTEQHSTSTNTSRLVCRESGYYHVYGQVSIGNVSAGTLGAMIRLNAAGLQAGGQPVAETRQPPNNNAANNQIMPLSGVIPMNVGDYVELFGYMTIGSAVAYGTGVASTFLGMHKVSETGQGASQFNHLSDVEVTSPAANQMLLYDAASGTWENGIMPSAAMYMANSGAPTHNGGVGTWQKVGAGGGTSTWVSEFDIRNSGATAQVDTVNKRMNVTTTGTYLVQGAVTFNGSTPTSSFFMAIALSGTRVAYTGGAPGNQSEAIMGTSCIIQASAGQFFELQAFHQDSASEAYNVGSPYFNRIAMTWLGPA